VKEPSIKKSTLSTLVVMTSTFVSRMFGFVRIAVIGAIFGASGQADVLNAVFTIPNNLRKLMAEGALSSAFIPVLSKTIALEPEGGKARRIARNIFTLQIAILVPLLVLAVIFSREAVKVILDFPEHERVELASRLFRWMIHYLLLISVSAVIMGAINAHSSFLVPAVTPILFSVAVISSVFLFHKTLGVFSMAVGVLAGGLGQILFQYPKFKSLGYDFKLDWKFDNPEFRQIMKQWLPVVATSSIYTINEQIAIRFATALEDGSTSAMSNALVFWQLPSGIFSASIATVLFPRMSRQAGLKDEAGLKASLEYGLRYLIILLVPSSIVLSLWGKEIVAVALQRGNFSQAHTLLTARVLFGFNLGLLSAGVFGLFQRFFYAVDDYKTPLKSAVVVSAIDIVLSLWLKETSFRVTGLALANSAAFTLGMVLMYAQASKRSGGLNGKTLFSSFGKACLTFVPLLALHFILDHFWGDWWTAGSTLGNFLRILLVGAAAAAIVVAIYSLLGIDILKQLFRKEKEEKT